MLCLGSCMLQTFFFIDAFIVVYGPEYLICLEAWAKLAQQWLVGIHLDPINKELMLLVTI